MFTLEKKKASFDEIPADWEEKRIGEFAKTGSGGTPKRSNLKFYENGHINWFKTGELGSKYIYESEERITSEAIKNSSAKLFPANSLIIAMYGATIGKSSIMKKESSTNQACCAIYENNNFNTEFLYYQFERLKNKLIVRGVGGAQPNISQDIIRTFPVPFPVLKEQNKIADILSTWDKAIELKQQLIDLKKEQKKGLMQKLLTGKVRWEGFNINWTSLKLNEIGETFNGLSGKTKNDFSDVEGKPYITYKSIFDDYKVNIDKVRYVDIEEDENQNKVKYGDVLFTTSSETPHEVGMSAVFLENVDEVYLNSFSFGFRINDFNTLNPEFAQFLFRGRDFRKVITSIAQGSTRFNLSKKQFMKTQILVPDLQGQYKIKEILDTITLEIELLEKELNIIKEQKKGLMQQLLTGKTRVKV